MLTTSDASLKDAVLTFDNTVNVNFYIKCEPQ